LGSGTTATFWIPFNKPQYQDEGTALIDIGSLPDRLQSEVSVSRTSSEREHMARTPPPISPDNSDESLSKTRRSSMTPSVHSVHDDLGLSRDDRGKVEVLVVEDK